MTVRIQVLLGADEREAFRRRASAEGLSLSAWLREAGRERLVEAEKRERLDTPAALREFFLVCDGREEGAEPDWEEHLRVIRASRRSGEADS